MRKLFFPLVLSIFFPAFLCLADMTAFNKAPDAKVMPGVIKKQDIQPIQDLGVLKINYKDVMSKRKINMEDIEGDSLNKKDPVDMELKNKNSKYAGFLKAVSKDYKINKNVLSLTKVPTDRRKRAIMFVFLMNQKTPEAKLKENQRSRMHIMWPGSKVFLTEQKVVDDQYPIDISIANYQDGYAPQEWNFVLPNKKPREVDIALLWSF